MQLLGVDALSILHVELDDLHPSVWVERIEIHNNSYTYTTRFWDFHDRHPIAVRALHLDIQFLVAHDKDHVDCESR
jgi:hypothetical protein